MYVKWRKRLDRKNDFFMASLSCARQEHMTKVGLCRLCFPSTRQRWSLPCTLIRHTAKTSYQADTWLIRGIVPCAQPGVDGRVEFSRVPNIGHKIGNVRCSAMMDVHARDNVHDFEVCQSHGTQQTRVLPCAMLYAHGKQGVCHVPFLCRAFKLSTWKIACLLCSRRKGHGEVSGTWQTTSFQQWQAGLGGTHRRLAEWESSGMDSIDRSVLLSRHMAEPLGVVSSFGKARRQGKGLARDTTRKIQFTECPLLCREQFFGHSAHRSLPSVFFETLGKKITYGKNSVCREFSKIHLTIKVFAQCFFITLGKQCVPGPWPHEKGVCRVSVFCHTARSLFSKYICLVLDKHLVCRVYFLKHSANTVCKEHFQDLNKFKL